MDSLPSFSFFKQAKAILINKYRIKKKKFNIKFLLIKLILSKFI